MAILPRDFGIHNQVCRDWQWSEGVVAEKLLSRNLIVKKKDKVVNQVSTFYTWLGDFRASRVMFLRVCYWQVHLG